MQFATNHLGHFALALGLHDSLAAAGSARIVSVSSGGHLRSPVVFDDIDYAFRDYDPFGAYVSQRPPMCCSPSKPLAGGLPRASCQHPDAGRIATPLQRHLPAHYAEQALEAFRAGGTRLQVGRTGSGDIGAVGGSPLLDGIGGRYFEDCNEAVVVNRRGGPGRGGVAPYALDPAMPNGCGNSR